MTQYCLKVEITRYLEKLPMATVVIYFPAANVNSYLYMLNPTVIFFKL